MLKSDQNLAYSKLHVVQVCDVAFSFTQYTTQRNVLPSNSSVAMTTL